MTAEELLNKLEKNKRIIRNADYEIYALNLRIDDLQAEIYEHKRERDKAALELGATKEAIEAMPTTKYREMLKRHYVDGQTWESVSEVINYSLAQLYNYRPLAIEEFQKTWDRIRK